MSEPTVSAVGTSFTRVIERWEIEHARELNEPTGKTVRPHFRRAHPHKYWAGEGRKIPRYRYLLLISVKGGKVVEEPEHARETAVR